MFNAFDEYNPKLQPINVPVIVIVYVPGVLICYDVEGLLETSNFAVASDWTPYFIANMADKQRYSAVTYIRTILLYKW